MFGYRILLFVFACIVLVSCGGQETGDGDITNETSIESEMDLSSNDKSSSSDSNVASGNTNFGGEQENIGGSKNEIDGDGNKMAGRDINESHHYYSSSSSAKNLKPKKSKKYTITIKTNSLDCLPANNKDIHLEKIGKDGLGTSYENFSFSSPDHKKSCFDLDLEEGEYYLKITNNAGMMINVSKDMEKTYRCSN